MRKVQLSIYYLQELNYRLIYTIFGTMLLFFTTYNYKQTLIFLILPQGLSHFVSSDLTEIFLIYIKLCTSLSLNLSILLTCIQIYLFLRPGLYLYEAKLSFKLLFSAFCFYLCLYIYIFPPIIKLLWQVFSTYSQNFTPIHLTFEPRLHDYLKNIIQLNQILNLSFPCIILLNLLQKYTTTEIWIKFRGFAYIIAFTIAAFMTPPDILSQIIIGLPLIIFYELQITIWAIYKNYKKKLLIRQPIK